jgi:hypothetical protein
MPVNQYWLSLLTAAGISNVELTRSLTQGW